MNDARRLVALAVLLLSLSLLLLLLTPVHGEPCTGAPEDCEMYLVQQTFLPVVMMNPTATLMMSSTAQASPVATPVVAPTVAAGE